MGGVTLVVVPPKVREGLIETLRVRVEHGLLKRIDAVATHSGRKRSDVVRLLMIAGLELHEAEAKGKK